MIRSSTRSIERLELQMADSLYLFQTFHRPSGGLAEIGTIRKYYGSGTGLRAIDQEDTTYVANERQCPCVFQNVLRCWEEPCNAPIGEWRTYWPNGTLKSRGGYYPREFEATFDTSYVVADTIQQYGTVSVPEQIFMRYTKDTRVKVGPWEYFDEEGKLMKAITYEPVWLDQRRR